MSQIDKVVIGSRRRLLSDDFNNAERLSSRALLEGLSAAALGDIYKLAAAGVGGVIGGLTVRAVVGTNEVEVQPGIAVVAVTPASATYDAPVEWIELGVATRIDLNALVDGGNPRLVTIEIEPAQVAKVTAAVDVFVPATGLFGIAVQDIVTGSSPILTATPGAAAASPVVAAGTVGRIPLAVVKLATAQVSFTDPFISVLLRRPLLAAGGGGTIAPVGAVEGGGFSSGEVNAAAIAGTQSAELHDFRCELSGLLARGHGPAEFGGTNIRTVTGSTVASLTATSKPVYGYACPAPWVSDYGTIAPSECRALNPNNLNQFSTAESVVLGDGSTFGSLAYGNGPAAQYFSLENMILLLDPTAPSGVTFGASFGPQGGPPRIDDIRGTHPTINSAGSITLEATQDPTWGGPQIVTDAVYVGSISAISVAGSIMGQSYRGRGMVRAIDVAAARPYLSAVVSTGILDSLYPGAFPAMGAGDAAVIPPYATRVEVAGKLTNTGAAGIAELTLKSAFGFGALSANPGFGATQRIRYDGGDLVNASEFSTGIVPLERDQTGQCYITGLVGGGGTLEVTLHGYEDPILAQR